MVPAEPDAIGPLRRQLRRWARRQGAPAAVQANVALAFSEACTAVIGPAPSDARRGGPLILEAWTAGDELRVRVSHRSRGTREPSAGMGYGFALALIAQVCDDFEVRRREDRPGTAFEMSFSLERAPEPARSSPLRPSRSTPRR